MVGFPRTGIRLTSAAGSESGYWYCHIFQTGAFSSGLLPGPQDRRQRSAPVPGRSNAGWHRDVLVFQGLWAFSRCCARGRAHSGLVVHPSVSSVNPVACLPPERPLCARLRTWVFVICFRSPPGASSSHPSASRKNHRQTHSNTMVPVVVRRQKSVALDCQLASVVNGAVVGHWTTARIPQSRHAVSAVLFAQTGDVRMGHPRPTTDNHPYQREDVSSPFKSRDPTTEGPHSMGFTSPSEGGSGFVASIFQRPYRTKSGYRTGSAQPFRSWLLSGGASRQGI